MQPISAKRLSELDGAGWELYHVAEDPAETHNVAADNRDRLIALISTWYAEAGKYGVLPIDGSGLARMIAEKPLIAPPRDQYTLWPNTQPVPFFAGPRVLNRPHSITAFVEIPDSGAEGVLLCQGTAAGGYSLYMKDQRLHYVHNYVGRSLFEVSSPEPVPPGEHKLRFEFEPTGKPDLPEREGCARTPAVVRRREPRRRRRCGRDDAFVAQSRRPHLWRQPRLPRHPGLPQPVQVHRHPPQGRHRHQR